MRARIHSIICASLAVAALMADTVSAVTITNLYHTNRVFRLITNSIYGTPTAYQVKSMAGKLTEVVGPTNIIVHTNNTFAREYEAVAWGYSSLAAAWVDVLGTYPTHHQTYTNQTYDNVGWIKGTRQAYGSWGAFLWLMQNQVDFRTSETNIWIGPNGVTNYVVKVLVGSIGDYPPMTNVVDVGPTSLDGESFSQFPPPGVSTEAVYRADYRAFYDLGPEVMFANPDDALWSDLDQKRVLLCDEDSRVKIRVPRMPDLAAILGTFGNKLTIRTSGTSPLGQEITLVVTNTMLVQGNDYSELRIVLSRDDLKSLGVLPDQEADSVFEKAWYDRGLKYDFAESNLRDGRAYGNNMPGESRGQCTQYGGLDLTPPNSPLDGSFFKAGGVEIIMAEYGHSRSSKQQIMNQADYFYYSGHGNHSNACLSAGCPSDVSSYWNKDMDVAVFAGCSVLDINDYNNNYTNSYEEHIRSPGEDWEPMGPGCLLGYNYLAPKDIQNSDAIVLSWIANRSSLGNIDAWKEANNNINGHNACAIEAGANYYYFHRTDFGEFSIWIWRTVPKSSW